MGNYLLLDYGYRSKCCFAPIRKGYKKKKNSKERISLWVCCNCGKRDVNILQYNIKEAAQSTSSSEY